MDALSEIALFLIMILLFFGIIGAIVCGIYYKKKQKSLISGLFLGSFTGLLAGMFAFGAVVFLFFL